MSCQNYLFQSSNIPMSKTYIVTAENKQNLESLNMEPV